MKRTGLLLIALLLLIAGCEYQSPLTEEHGIPVDPAVLGVWEEVPDKTDPATSPDRMLVLKFSDTEYLIEYPTGTKALYFRGYPVRIADIDCVQVQLIGTADGAAVKASNTYHVVTYAMGEGELEMKLLNTKLVSGDLNDSAALRQAFMGNKGNKDLFRNPGRFRKIVPAS